MIREILFQSAIDKHACHVRHLEKIVTVVDAANLPKNETVIFDNNGRRSKDEAGKHKAHFH